MSKRRRRTPANPAAISRRLAAWADAELRRGVAAAPPLFTGSDLRFNGYELHPVPGSTVFVDLGDVVWKQAARIDNRPPAAR